MKKALVAVSATSALALAVWVGAGSLLAAGSAGPAPTGWSPKAGLDLAQGQPQQLRPNAAGIVDVDLRAATGTIPVSGTTLKATPWNGRLQAPTIHVRPGGTIRVRFANDLKPTGALMEKQEFSTNIHYHGLHVSPLRLGDNIFRTFPKGSQDNLSVVHLPSNHPPGTFWYHVHFHGVSDQQVMGGLSGLLVVDGLEELLPRSLRGVKQRQLALRTVQVDKGQIIGEGAITPGAATATRLVNTLYKPKFTMPAGRYELWRLANISSDDFFKVGFQGHRFAVIAEDGAPVWKVVQRTSLVLATGKRFDVLVKVDRPGTYALQSLPYAQTDPPAVPANPETLATVRVTGEGPGRAPELPARLASKSDLGSASIDRRRTFRFAYKSMPFLAVINGKAFHPDEMPAAAPVLGDVEEWTLINKTGDDHPFHIHVNDFQVMRINGVPQDAHGLNDVVIIPKQQTVNGKVVDGRVVIRQRYTDYDGWFVFHCHILDHEDFGMMATIQVRRNEDVPITPPPGELPPTTPSPGGPHH